MKFNELRVHIAKSVKYKRITRSRDDYDRQIYIVDWIGPDKSIHRHIIHFDDYLNDIFDLKFDQLYNDNVDYILY